MVTRISDALNAYAAVAGRVAAPGIEAREPASGPNFGEMVRDMVADSIDLGQTAEQTSGDALVGKADLSEVVMAVSNAEISLQTIVSIRDKMIEAYQEILRMPI